MAYVDDISGEVIECFDVTCVDIWGHFEDKESDIRINQRDIDDLLDDWVSSESEISILDSDVLLTSMEGAMIERNHSLDDVENTSGILSVHLLFHSYIKWDVVFSTNFESIILIL